MYLVETREFTKVYKEELEDLMMMQMIQVTLKKKRKKKVVLHCRNRSVEEPELDCFKHHQSFKDHSQVGKGKMPDKFKELLSQIKNQFQI